MATLVDEAHRVARTACPGPREFFLFQVLCGCLGIECTKDSSPALARFLDPPLAARFDLSSDGRAGTPKFQCLREHLSPGNCFIGKRPTLKPCMLQRSLKLDAAIVVAEDAE